MIDTVIIPFLKEQLQLPLPGQVAQAKMTTRAKFTATPKNARLASVLCLLYPKNGAWHLPLIQRVITKNDKHSGQISFPGGKKEATDATNQAAALREANEEIGIKKEDVTLLGDLTPLYVPASNFQVFPFIGCIDYTPTFIRQEREVAEVVEVALNQLIHPKTKKYKTITFGNGYTIKDVPYYDVNGKTVWGATAMMLSEFVTLINQKKVLP
ncbi:MAG: CoA pyrophosphatase [Saprospiraceae bacterium]